LGVASPARGETLVLSRHSGEILSGVDAPVPTSPEAAALVTPLGVDGRPLTRRDLAEGARVAAAASSARELHLQGPGWQIDADPDRIVLGERKAPEIPMHRSGPADTPVEVQVFGLVGPERVEVRCTGAAVSIAGGHAGALPGGWQVLSRVLRDREILCTSGPWSVRVAGGSPRPYAGVLLWRPTPDRRPEPGETARQARARRGSDVVFRTTLGAYVAGVLTAEHDGLEGAARQALVQVVAHDASVSRHGQRPVCDTTHCQVFRGTAGATAADLRALSSPPLPTQAWLPYFRGGREPWTARRPVGQVRALLGDVTALEGAGQHLQTTNPVGTMTRPCEPVRSALRLPACPRSAEFDGQTIVFHGEGQGHGLGLDVDAAARSSLTANALLERAYGLHLSD
jgi:hypothetical protein